MRCDFPLRSIGYFVREVMHSRRQTAIEASSISGQAIGPAFTRGVLPLGRTPADDLY